ncbi:DOMON domain-containing protein [Lentilitoribacter sp. EG35]|uniref:DOMON domain-containing protein n=1 Tax=Lentilitoribacter sp. EG35 TaxID=3234192 RepID=UPI00345FA098
MNKRKFLTLATLATGSFAWPIRNSAMALPILDDQKLEDSGVTFHWHHHQNRIVGKLTAPTRGWIAVGFNAQNSLKNTRFVMATVSTPAIHIEEHEAGTGGHQSIESLGGKRTVKFVNSEFLDGISCLEFSFPHEISDRPDLDLSPGSPCYLMLAWSNSIDFDHHSAWRQHYKIIL